MRYPRFFSALFCSVFLLGTSPVAQGQTSTSNSPTPSSSSSTTQKLTPQDFAQSQIDLAIIRAQFKASQQALTDALAQKQIIENNLADATQKYDDLLASVTAHSGDSTTYLQQLLEDIRKLKQQLADSQTSIVALQVKLESQATELEAKLSKAQVDAKALELQNGILRIGLYGLGLLAAGEAVYIAGHSLGAWK